MMAPLLDAALAQAVSVREAALPMVPDSRLAAWYC